MALIHYKRKDGTVCKRDLQIPSDLDTLTDEDKFYFLRRFEFLDNVVETMLEMTKEY